MTTVNFTQVLQDAKGASFEALPIGDYDVEVVEAQAVTAGTGRPMIKTTFEIIVGPHTKRKIINNFVLVVDNPVALAFFFRNMKCFGLSDDFFAALGPNGTLEPVAQAMLGKRVRLQLTQREWQGEMRNDVKTVKPYTGAPGALGNAGPQGLTGVPSPGPAAYGALPTGPTPTGPAPTAPTPGPAAPAPAAPAPTPAPAPAPAPQPEAPQPVQEATPPPPALPI